MTDRFKKLRDEHVVIAGQMQAPLVDICKRENRELFTVLEAKQFQRLYEKSTRIRDRMTEHVESRQEILAELKGTGGKSES